jgi:two-component system phosphate regulon response regulator PhoB
MSGAPAAREFVVLVVEDELSILRSLTYILTRSGFRVEEARDGEEGLRKVRELRPGLVVLDVMMPGRNGFEICTEIKSDPLFRETYVIMLTAKGQQTDRERGLRCGADEYLTKPFSPKEIVARAKEVERRQLARSRG